MWKKALLLFAVVVAVGYFFRVFEGFENPNSRRISDCPTGYRQCPGGDCVLLSDKHAPCPGRADAY